MREDLVNCSAANRVGWAHKAIASCYFYTPLPNLVKPLRERYLLARRPQSRWRRFEKREGPTARILYYHRVNDDQDPFFPAISTELFEREIEFVARQYKVVSLDRMMQHLDGSDSETLVTITFDDGYLDNFTQAFPILQRHNVPATIFLTTGSIDNREPLWFEQLSLALKKTSREELLLEGDRPQRFQLRTQTERLECNSQIQKFLSTLPDKERRRWVSRILSSLAVEGDRERHDKMLTWDQVRFMHARNVEFGGHTINHPFLSKTTKDEAYWEIAGCKTRIEEELQCCVDFFAYPNGHEADVSESNRDIVQRVGYRAAVTTTWGMNYAHTNKMELRRGGPWEESAALFAYKLDWYQITNE